MTTRLEASHWLLQQFGLIEEFSEKSERSEKEIRKSSVQSLEIMANGGRRQRYFSMWETGTLERLKELKGGRLETVQ